MSKKYRISLNEKEVKHFEKCWKMFMRDQSTPEKFAAAQVFCDIVGKMYNSIERSKKRNKVNNKRG